MDENSSSLRNVSHMDSSSSDLVPTDRVDKAQRNLHTLAIVSSSLRDLITQVSNRRSNLTEEMEIKDLMKDIMNILVQIRTVQTEIRNDQDISPSLNKEAIEVRQWADILTVLVDGVMAPPSDFTKRKRDLQLPKGLIQSLKYLRRGV